jgi:hypothetical protein
MRRHLQKFLPIVLIALMVQIFAPIGACWAAAVAASDPLGAVPICHDTSAVGGESRDQGGPEREHGAGCAICCLASASASVDTPKIQAFATPYRVTARVAWHDQALDVSGSPVRFNAQARAPPSIS